MERGRRKGTGKLSVIGDKVTLADKLEMKSLIAIWKLSLTSNFDKQKGEKLWHLQIIVVFSE